MKSSFHTSPFIGRAAELEALARILKDVHEGEGRLVTIVGEAGMGKTRLMAELSDLAQTQGMQVLWSQLIEDPGAPPYLPWLLALRSYIQMCSDETLQLDLGSAANDVACIVPELRDRLGLIMSPSQSGDEANRYQLFDSVSRWLLSASKRQPLVVLLDNLHLADGSSLALLEYFCQQLPGHAVLVVGAYRQTELMHQHPLSRVLSRLSRNAGFVQMVMGGFSRGETAELVHAYLAHPPPAPLVDSVHEQSGGNPLFVKEVGCILARRSPQEPLPGAGFHFRVPDSLREVIRTRLDILNVDTCRVLGVASVLGRDFELGMVADLAESGTEHIARSLHNAEIAQVIEKVGVNKFRFNHILFREVLYGEHSTVARTLLHRKAGEHLEKRYQDDLQPHISRLAYHYFESAQGGRERKAVNYCRLAAESAITQRAYSEATALYECALQALELSEEPDLECRFKLLRALGHAQYQSGQLNAATQSLMKSVILAHRQNWWEPMANALFLFQHVCQQSGMRHVASIPLHEVVLEHIPRQSVGLRARMLASMARACRTAAEPQKAQDLFRESIELARESGDERILLDCLRKGAWTVGRMPSNVREGLEISHEALQLARLHGPVEAVLDSLTDMVFQLCEMGNIEELQHYLAQLRSLAQQQRQVHFLNLLLGFETALSILQGRWQEAEHRAREAVRQVPLQGVSGLEGRFAFQMFAIHKAKGSLTSLANVANRIISTTSGSQLWVPGQVLLHLELGQPQLARDALERMADLRALPKDDLHAVALAFLAEACFRLRDIPKCAQLFDLLMPYRNLNISLPGTVMLGAASGYLAKLAVVMRKYSEANILFEEAIVKNTAMGADPALAWVKVDFARHLLRRKQQEYHQHARQLLAEAHATANKLELKPVLVAIEGLEAGGVVEHLTVRELQVLSLIANGCSNRAIADALHVSHSTVATHVRNIFRKTGVSNRTEAADYARRADLLPP